ncbi:MarR family winged helix-turn-helix transcriptional regulator [Microvirga aerophila]|nr:MarR family winged helix-turn-helix transcriptional regulator [Microvirga aerophila]
MSPLNERIQHPSEDSLGWALAQAARLHRFYLNEKLAGMGLFAGQEQALQVLSSYDEVSMGELAGILRVRTPTASKTVTRLAALGLVARSCNPIDARTVRVRLTRKGRMAVARIQTLWDEVESDMVAGLDAEEQRQMRKLLLRAAMNLAGALGSNRQDTGAVPAALDHHPAHRRQSSRKADVLATSYQQGR